MLIMSVCLSLHVRTLTHSRTNTLILWGGRGDVLCAFCATSVSRLVHRDHVSVCPFASLPASLERLAAWINVSITENISALRLLNHWFA